MIEYFSLSFFYRIAKDACSRSRKNRRSPPSPTEIVQLRQKWKSEFEAKIWERRSAGLRSDVIVRDVRRADNYPNLDEKSKGTSPWFRVGLGGIYHRGIQLGLRWGTLTRDEGRQEWRYTDHENGETGEIKVLLIGYVPYENIEAVDWHGDEFYGFPHVYCHFDEKRKEPYERCAFCEQKVFDSSTIYFEVAEYDAVRKSSKRRGVDYFA